MENLQRGEQRHRAAKVWHQLMVELNGNPPFLSWYSAPVIQLRQDFFLLSFRSQKRLPFSCPPLP